MEIIKYLSNSDLIHSFDVLELKTFKYGFYIKIKAKLFNNSELFINEYSDKSCRDYSYHWRQGDNSEYIRWDNAPHHKKIKTYPHHMHIDNKIIESNEVTINDVLKHLTDKLKK